MSEEALEIPERSPNEPVPSLKRPEGIAGRDLGEVGETGTTGGRPSE